MKRLVSCFSLFDFTYTSGSDAQRITWRAFAPLLISSFTLLFSSPPLAPPFPCLNSGHTTSHITSSESNGVLTTTPPSTPPSFFLPFPPIPSPLISLSSFYRSLPGLLFLCCNFNKLLFKKILFFTFLEEVVRVVVGWWNLLVLFICYLIGRRIMTGL